MLEPGVSPLLDSTSDSPASSLLVTRLSGLRDRLLHITARNRSILLGTLTPRSSFDMATLGASTCTDSVRRLLRGTSVAVSRDSRSDDAALRRRRDLATLARTLKQNRDETGLRTGNIGFPFLVGALDESIWIRAPVVLLPIKLVRKDTGRDSGWHAEVRDGTRPTANRALLAAVEKVRGVRLGEAFTEELEALLEEHAAASSEDWDWNALLSAVEMLLAQHGLPVPLAEDRTPRPLPSLTKADRDRRRDEKLHLEPFVVLGDFPQTNEPIHADYKELLDAAHSGGKDVSLLARLMDAEEGVEPLPADPEPPLLDSIPDRELGTVMASNGSQDDVLLAARHQRLTVVRGPPGTGKSQVIANLVTDALRHGEKVMVVCQKRAALDVVFERLQVSGLGDSALLVHDPQADRKETFARIARLLEQGEVLEDEDVMAMCDEVDGLVDDCNRLAALFGEDHHGRTRFDVYSHADASYVPVLSGRPLIRSASWNDVVATKNAIESMGEDVRELLLDHAWSGRRDLGTTTPPSRDDVERRLQALARAIDAPYLMAERAELERLAEAFGTWNAHRNDMMRVFNGAYKEARRTVQDFLATEEAPLDEAPRWATEVRQGLRVLDAAEAMTDVCSPTMLRNVTHAPFDVAQTRVEAWLAGLDDWNRLVQLDRDLAALPSAVRRLLLMAMDRLREATDVSWALEQEALHAWIAELEETVPELRGDPYREYDRKRRRLATLLPERQDAMAGAIRVELEGLAKTPVLPPGEHHPNRRAETDWNQVQAKLARKRNIPTLRAIVQEDKHAHVLARAARCWLMSPEAVSAVHPLLPGLFDLVVFDEASQLAVERALPAVYRAKRVVVAGDEKQLPPFQLFQGGLEDEDEDLETDSLLALSQAAFGSRMLQWHYRSEYQELVEFSNHAYYGGGLKVVPSPDAGVRPIGYHRIDGAFVDGHNPIEAEAVVDLMALLLARPKPPTVGVVTFNKAQRDRIEQIVDERAETDESFRALWVAALSRERLDDRPFIKNIENVQGDERDIIVFSTTYGPGADGKVRTNFGVFNQRGGENRLNVAVTRARKEIHVVTSIDPEQLKVENAAHDGPRHLKAYLQYARAVARGDHESASRVLSEVGDGAQRAAQGKSTPLHDALVEGLANLGYLAQSLVGYSGYRIDVAVAHPDDPERFVVAVELDGPAFRGAHGARERDVARPAFLQSRGWRVERVWSRDWFRDQEKQLNRVAAAVEIAFANQPGNAVAPAPHP